MFADRKSEFSVVILDLKMPGKDGWECLRELRSVREDIPIVICSGYDPKGTQPGTAQPGVAYLNKPFRLAELETVLSELLDVSADAPTTAT